MNILIVDDNQDNLMLLAAHLRKAGQEHVLSAGNAAEAYAILGMDESQAGHPVDLILMDYMMPEVNGVEACRHIKSMPRLADIPIIMVTANTDSELLEKAFAAGAMDYITKPVRKTEFLARVHSAIDLKRERDRRRERESELEQRNAELEKAMREIKTLRGFIPICSHCKKIRNVDGLWQQLEVYLTEHADVKMSHGLCEGCIKQHYPEFYKAQGETPPS